MKQEAKLIELEVGYEGDTKQTIFRGGKHVKDIPARHLGWVNKIIFWRFIADNAPMGAACILTAAAIYVILNFR